jgi:hypothetical protein
MGVDAIDQTICPSVLGMTKCSIAFGRWPHAIEHLVIPHTSGQIVWSIAPHPLNNCILFANLGIKVFFIYIIFILILKYFNILQY